MRAKHCNVFIDCLGREHTQIKHQIIKLGDFHGLRTRIVLAVRLLNVASIAKMGKRKRDQIKNEFSWLFWTHDYMAFIRFYLRSDILHKFLVDSFTQSSCALPKFTVSITLLSGRIHGSAWVMLLHGLWITGPWLLSSRLWPIVRFNTQNHRKVTR